jgi:hypothetical protein
VWFKRSPELKPQYLKKKKRIQYPAKLSFKNENQNQKPEKDVDEGIKAFPDKQY